MTASPVWIHAATMVGRLIFAGVFGLAVTFKFMDIHATAGYIEMVGLPFPLLLACCVLRETTRPVLPNR